MKALSVRQPWAWAICHAGKRVENREWQHAPSYRGPLLIHASAGVGTLADFDEAVEAMLDAANLEGQEARDAMYEGRVADELRDRWAPALALPRGAIVARARLVDVVHTMAGGHRVLAESALTARTLRCLLCNEASAERICDAPCPKADPWAIRGCLDCLGLILDDVVPLAQPIPLKGALGFFEVPDALLAAEAVQP